MPSSRSWKRWPRPVSAPSQARTTWSGPSPAARSTSSSGEPSRVADSRAAMPNAVAPVEGAGVPVSASARHWTISGVSSAALAPLNSTMIAVALPEMGRDLQLGSTLLRHGLVTSYLLTGIVLQSLGGKLADRIGYGRALRLGQVVFALAGLLGFLWPAAGALVAARVIMAAAGA